VPTKRQVIWKGYIEEPGDAVMLVDRLMKFGLEQGSGDAEAVDHGRATGGEQTAQRTGCYREEGGVSGVRDAVCQHELNAARHRMHRRDMGLCMDLHSEPLEFRSPQGDEAAGSVGRPRVPV
jgi:hypothetical protein